MSLHQNNPPCSVFLPPLSDTFIFSFDSIFGFFPIRYDIDFGPRTQHISLVWNLLRCVLCCDWPIQNLKQSAVGHTNQPVTFARSWSDHLGKRGSPTSPSPLTPIVHEIEIWKDQRRPQHVPSSILAGFGPDIHVYRVKSNLPYFPCPGGRQSFFPRYEMEKRLKAVYFLAGNASVKPMKSMFWTNEKLFLMVASSSSVSISCFKV